MYLNWAMLKSAANAAWLPSFPRIPTPTLAIWIIPTSFPPSPMLKTTLPSLSLRISVTRDFMLGEHLARQTPLNLQATLKNFFLLSFNLEDIFWLVRVSRRSMENLSRDSLPLALSFCCMVVNLAKSSTFLGGLLKFLIPEDCGWSVEYWSLLSTILIWNFLELVIWSITFFLLMLFLIVVSKKGSFGLDPEENWSLVKESCWLSIIPS